MMLQQENLETILKIEILYKDYRARPQTFFTRFHLKLFIYLQSGL